MREIARFADVLVGESTSYMPSPWRGSYVHYSVLRLKDASAPCPDGATTRYRVVKEVIWTSDPVPRGGKTPRSGRVQALNEAIQIARRAAGLE